MTNPPAYTGYEVAGIDLINIFKTNNNISSTITTGFKDPCGNDIGLYFSPFTIGGGIGYNTNYLSGGVDLSTIFLDNTFWSKSSLVNNFGADDIFFGICCSSSGQIINISQINVGIWTSTNYGNTFTQITTVANATTSEAICCDSTGLHIVASSTQGMYTNTNSSGALQTPQFSLITSLTPSSWPSLCSDSTGQYLACISVTPGGIYISQDYGNTWGNVLNLTSNIGLNAICSDSTGQYLAACTNDGIWTSNVYGSLWTSQTSTLSKMWASICSDSTGQYLAACVDGGGIWTSNDYGSLWTHNTFGLPSTASWTSICSSSTGNNLACNSNINIFSY